MCDYDIHPDIDELDANILIDDEEQWIEINQDKMILESYYYDCKSSSYNSINQSIAAGAPYSHLYITESYHKNHTDYGRELDILDYKIKVPLVRYLQNRRNE